MKQPNPNQPGNLVPFPNLKQRLLDKGMDALKHKKYQEALDLLQQTIEMDPDLEEVQLGIVVCLFELGQLEEAKEKCQVMLKQDIGDYFEVLQIYLTILVQLGQYKEVESTIEAVLQEGDFPSQTVETFYRLLDFSRKMNVNKEVEQTQPEFEVEQLLEDISIADQLSIIQALRSESHGISFSYAVIDSFLLDETKHPLVKTAILHMFMEKEISRSLEIEKFGRRMTIQTGELQEVSQHPFTLAVLTLLDDTLGNENPSLFEVVKEIWYRQLSVLYPFLPYPEEEVIWAAGLHKVGYDFHGIDIESEEIAELYQIAARDLRFASSQIREIEEISFLPL
ncbi:tetratricopeptide repeat protein [Bacillus pinisoli]|uniref:tetratricopeptide repeat protein n=1 Tax=Bacillus pinisoli TaxID=2901866 RepID=UPI001FF62AEF|nr:tetratricopeptide repeat protein [Bacillus pinisoli]